MTRIKVCGITSLEDALAACEAGVNALGFVFAESSRQVQPVEARQIITALPPFVSTVGVFVDSTLKDIELAVETGGVDYVQLHGEESRELCESISMPVIKTIIVRAGESSVDVHRRIEEFPFNPLLLDSGRGGGGTFNWSIARGVRSPLIVAGGLDSGNVRQCLEEISPFGVDVSSGVETEPGKKDYEKLRAFVRAVRAFDVARDSATNLA